MANPSEKAEGIDQFLTKLTGVNRKEAIIEDVCVTCSKPVKRFRDPLSRKEYTISGMCQACQDSVFGR